MDEDVNDAIGTAVRRYREHLGMSQQELGRRMSQLGFSWHQMTVQRTETAKRALRLDEAVALASIFDIPIEDLYRQDADEESYERVLNELTIYEETLATTQARVAEFHARANYLGQEAMEARRRFDDAQLAYDQAVRAAQESAELLAAEQRALADYDARVDSLRSQLERLRAGRDAEDVLRGLAPNVLMDLTIKNVTGTRVVSVPGGAVFEVLVGPDRKTAARSQLYETRQDAAAAATALVETFADRRRELYGNVEFDETRKG